MFKIDTISKQREDIALLVKQCLERDYSYAREISYTEWETILKEKIGRRIFYSSKENIHLHLIHLSHDGHLGLPQPTFVSGMWGVYLDRLLSFNVIT